MIGPLRQDILRGTGTRHDLVWLLGVAFVLIASGIGLRDPWPADEPRFVLIARDMLASGDWLIPRVGGDLYADKPPLYFWLLGASLWLTGGLRSAFLLPSLLAGLGCTALIYDLGRRLWTRQIGLIAGFALLVTVQFIWQARQAQIDAVLCFWTTLGFYGFMRHLLLGPQWRWYVVAWAAAGLGVITKGVGFLPILILIPFLLARAARWPVSVNYGSPWRWALGPVVMLAIVSLWLVPMVWAASFDPELARYRDEILFDQTIKRFGDAWHHREPFWYFFVQVMPLLWLPWIALLPWLGPQWLERWRARDLRIVLPLAWVMLVLLFFSFSTGKRGVYILPSVPAFVLACAPCLSELFARRGPNRLLLLIAGFTSALLMMAAVFLLVKSEERASLIASYGIDPVAPLIAMSLGGLLACGLFKARGWLAFGSSLAAWLLIVSFWAVPQMNEVRSGKQFMRKVEDAGADTGQLAMVAYKEQYLLQATRPIVNFGHARWRDREQESADAAAWLVASPDRALVVDEYARDLCFQMATAHDLGMANRQRWFLVRGAAASKCVAKGTRAAAIVYEPTG